MLKPMSDILKLVHTVTATAFFVSLPLTSQRGSIYPFMTAMVMEKWYHGNRWWCSHCDGSGKQKKIDFICCCHHSVNEPLDLHKKRRLFKIYGSE